MRSVPLVVRIAGRDGLHVDAAALEVEAGGIEPPWGKSEKTRSYNNLRHTGSSPRRATGDYSLSRRAKTSSPETAGCRSSWPVLAAVAEFLTEHSIMTYALDRWSARVSSTSKRWPKGF